jgi:hypothetical protein
MGTFLKVHLGIEKAPRHLHLQNRESEIIGILARNLDTLSPVLGIHDRDNLALLVFPDSHENPILEIVFDIFLFFYRRRIGKGRIPPQVVISARDIGLRRLDGLKAGRSHRTEKKSEKFHRFNQVEIYLGLGTYRTLLPGVGGGVFLLTPLTGVAF